MLLPFRWLLYGTAAASSETTAGSHRNRKIQRKLRKLARWSEAVGPPLPEVIAPVQGIALVPKVGVARISIAAPVSSSPLRFKTGLITASVSAPVSSTAANLAIGTVNVIAEVDLFDYEIAALMAA